ncbi:RNA-directed DNA polymerase, eukaryota, reverse transcriptase zinc-binding domain protein [Tanacetum coccineum]
MGNDIVAAITKFFSSCNFPPRCNSTFIALIPKIHDAKTIKDFRPISLIGSIYKIIAKILANRLSLVIPDLINEVRTAFVPNRQILDGPFILNELISWCKHKKINAMIFKVDFDKAFDSVRWDYLDDILKSFGFGDKWRSWIAVKVGSSMSRIKAWQDVIDKISSRLSKWKIKALSSGGRLTLLKSILTALPFIICRSIKLIRHQQSSSFQMVMEIFYPFSSLWANFIKAIHGVKGNIDESNPNIRGSIWQELVREFSSLKAKGIDCVSYIKRKLGNGENTSFWEDIWLGDSALKSTHPRLFALETRNDITVAGKMGLASLYFSFRRIPRGGVEDEQLKNLVSITSQVLLPQMRDRWFWSLVG